MSIEIKGPSEEIISLARKARERIHAQNGQPATESKFRSFLREGANDRIMGSFDNKTTHQNRPVFPVYSRNNVGGTYGGVGKNRVPWS